jgi:uncharacterized protein YxjI
MEHALVKHVQGVGLQTQCHYRIKRKFWSVFERTFRVYTMDGQMIMLVQHPVFRLREEFQVYSDEAKTRPILRFKTRQMIAINFSYDVTDLESGEHIGTIQKRGLRSLIRDKFRILDPAGEDIGSMEETGASLLRRFFPILTSRHEIVLNGRPAAKIRQIFRFFIREFEVHVNPEVGEPRFVLACAMLALIAEAARER